MNVLLSFIGSKDPFWTNPKGQRVVGPLLTLLQERTFDAIHLFFNLGSGWNERAGETLQACKNANRAEKIVYNPIDILDVSNHAELFRVMNHECQTILGSYKKQSAQFWVATASGTPAMQTVWVLLAQSGLFPATLLVTSPPQYTLPGKSAVREIDLNIDNFPQIQSPDAAKRQLSILQTQAESLKTQNAVLMAQSTAPLLLPDTGLDLRLHLRQQETALFRLALERTEGNAAEAARLLQISPHAFRKRAVDLGIIARKNTKGN